MLTEQQRQRFRALQQGETDGTLSPTEQAEMHTFIQQIVAPVPRCWKLFGWCVVLVTFYLISGSAKADTPHISLQELRQLWKQRKSPTLPGQNLDHSNQGEKYHDLHLHDAMINAPALSNLLADAQLPLRKPLWDNRIFLENCTIVGDLNLRDKTVRVSLNILHSRFLGNVDCIGTVFRQRILFDHTSFAQGRSVDFAGANFQADAWLTDCHCPENVNFRDAVFANIALFTGTYFGTSERSKLAGSYCYFNHAKFKRYCSI